MIFVNAGYLIALASPKDQLHRRANAWTGGLVEPLVASEYVLVETVNGLSSQLLKRGVARALTHDFHVEHAGFEALPRRDP